MDQGSIKIGRSFRRIRKQELGNLVLDKALQFLSGHVSIPGSARLDTIDNIQRGLDSHIAFNEGFFKLIEHIVIYSPTGSNLPAQLCQQPRSRLGKPLLQTLLILLLEPFKQPHSHVKK